MSKRSFRIALAIVVGTIVLALGTGVWLVHGALAYSGEAHDGSGTEIEVEVAKGMSFPDVASMLADKGVIRKPTWFRMYAMWEGDTTNIKTGKYQIKDNLSPEEVLKILVAGVKEKTVKVTIPEGKNMLECFAIIASAHVAPEKDLETLARDKDFIAKHGIAGDSIEGYLFPDTYEFRVDEKATRVLDRLITRHQEVWHALATKHAKELAKVKDKLSWSDRDMLTLASIVEKEAVDPAERPKIAQVFINRMTFSSFRPHRLETDPTIRYGCEVPLVKSEACKAWDKKDRLHRAQLDDVDNAYNTYQHEGLPPGPIGNPGKSSMEAAMVPESNEYLFFVAKDARNHAFAKSVEEHNKNVQKYMRGG